MSWTDMEFDGPPSLIVGLRRGGRRIEGHRVNTDTALAPDLLGVAQRTVERLDAMDAVDYTPYVGLGADEYLKIEPAALVSSTESMDGDGVVTQREQTAALLDLVQRSDELPELGAGQLLTHLDDEELYLQAICLRTAGGRVGFVTKSNKRQLLKRSVIPLGLDDANDRLKKVSRPELVLETDVHAVVGLQEVAIMNKVQFEFMVSDSGLVHSYAPAYVRRIAQAFGNRDVVLAPATIEALEAKALSSVRVARRLDAFAERIAEVDVARIINGDGFTSQALEQSDFVNAQGEIECGPARVVELLDALEGRFFGDAFTDEQRRADSFRKR